MNAMGLARGLLADLVVFDVSGRRLRSRAWLWFAVLTLYALWRSASMVAGPIPFEIEGHAMVALNEGINEVWCGKRALISNDHSIGLRLVQDPSLASIPVTTLIERDAGSVKAYCGSVTTAFANNENSVAVLDAAVLWFGGASVTPLTVARVLVALRLAILLMFCGVTLLAGGSVLLSVGVFEIGLALCRLTLVWPLALYPFLFVTPLISIALYVWLFHRADKGMQLGNCILLAGVGLAAAFGVNMRTSHLPAYVGQFALFLWLRRPAFWRQMAAVVVVVCAGYLVGHWAIATRREPRVTTYNASYHVVAHPLVLSLAVPDNALARREGIEWRDDAGLSLARRVDPSATYLGPTYERALFRYYWSLWRAHTLAMAGLYFLKFDAAGSGMDRALASDPQPVWASLGLWTMFDNGFVRLWVLIALLAASALAYRRWGRVFAALLAMLTLVALMLHIEMAMIMPSFVMMYHSFTVFFGAVLGLVAAQAGVNAAVRSTARGRGARSPLIEVPLIVDTLPLTDATAVSPTRVSVIAPVYNESVGLAEFVGRLAAVSHQMGARFEWEFVLVDDGSSDDSLSIAKGLIGDEPRLRVIELRRNFGQTAALQAGVAAARGDVIISMDSDLQHFPEDIPLFLAGIEQGYDLVCGWRYNRQEGILRRWPSRAANLLIRLVAGVAVHDFGTTFRAYRSDLVRHIQLLGEQHRFVPALAMQIGARIAEVKIRNIERPHGASNYGLGRTLNVFLDITFLYFSRRYFTRPLKAFGKIALLLLTAGTGIAGSLIAYSWMTGIPTVRERGGWFLLAALLMLASLQIMLTGLLAEVLVRVYYRSSHTDSYVIRDEWNVDTIGRASTLWTTTRT